MHQELSNNPEVELYLSIELSTQAVGYSFNFIVDNVSSHVLVQLRFVADILQVKVAQLKLAFEYLKSE